MDVTIYTKDNCSFCTNAKLLLTSKGIGYNEKKLGEDFSREILLDMFPEARTYPVIVIDGFNIGGYTELKEHLSTQTSDSRKYLIEG